MREMITIGWREAIKQKRKGKLNWQKSEEINIHKLDGKLSFSFRIRCLNHYGHYMYIFKNNLDLLQYESAVKGHWDRKEICISSYKTNGKICCFVSGLGCVSGLGACLVFLAF